MKKISFRRFINAINNAPQDMFNICDTEEIVTTRFPFSKNIHVLTKPSDLKHIFQVAGSNYIRDYNFLNGLRDVLEGGLDIEADKLALDSSALLKAFSPDNQAELVRKSVASFEKHLEEWKVHAKNHTEFNLEHELTLLFIHAYLDASLNGVKIDLMHETADVVNNFFYAVYPPNYYFRYLAIIPGKWTEPFRHYFRCKKLTTTVASQMLEESYKQTDDGYNLIKFLAKQYGYPSEREKLTDKQRRHLAGRGFGTLVSGNHNMVGILAHLIVRLAQNEDIYQKLREEVKNVLGNRTPTKDDFAKLTYTRNCFMESIRLHPAILYVFRLVVADDELSGVKIKKKDNIFVPQIVCHKREQYWDRPNEFLPERWNKPFTDDQKILFLGFSHGPQTCIAQQFSVIQATLFIAMLIQRFQFHLGKDTSLELDAKIFYLHERLNPNVMISVDSVPFES